MSAKKLKPTHLRWQCDKRFLRFYKDPTTFPAAHGVVGQKRALESLTLGLSIFRTGYNIYVAGMAGTGRTTTIRRTLEEMDLPCKLVPDRCYVYNFVEPSQPMLLTFTRGQGKGFRDDMAELIRVLRTEIPKTLESTHVVRERELIISRYQRDEKKVFEDFAERLKVDGFSLIQVQEGSFIAPTVFPMIGEEAVSLDHLETLVKEGKLSAEERDAKIRRHRELTAELKHVLSRARALGKEMHQALEKLMQRTSSLILDGLLDDMRGRYTDHAVRKYLLRVKSHILKNLDSFVGREKQPAEGMMVMAQLPRPEDPFWIYEVNLLHDQSQESNRSDTRCPIIEEQNPTYTNLFGVIEYQPGVGGMWSTDFRHIKGGSLLAADGGFLIVNALDILQRPHVWDQLKRILKTEKLIIQQPETYFQFAQLAMKPEPIELSVKVIMIGPEWVYDLLWNYEEDFSKTFKVLAGFDSSMALTEAHAKQYAQVLKSVSDRGGHRLLDASGLAAMIEHGVEEAGQRSRLSARFAYITDVLREADHAAEKNRARLIARTHVQEAIAAQRYRTGLTEERVQRLIEEGVLLIDTKGKRVGQVNGLAVYSMGYASFGRPTRITAVTSVGRAGVVNIEREAHLSGPIHDKGVLILSGYLRHKYAQKKHLTLSASVAFEQSYSGVDGDSASSTEIYAILSSLSGFSIDQGLAVTGSVNQLGDIQPVGGINEKIEGFFDVCKAQKLTGKQGVIIPVQNEQHLMLREDVVEAVRKGKFHIYSVKNIDEGIELLTGKKAGQQRKSGSYPPHTVHGVVAQRLEDITEAIGEGTGNGEGHPTVIAGDEKPVPKPPRSPRQK